MQWKMHKSLKAYTKWFWSITCTTRISILHLTEKACEVIEVTNGTSSSTGNYFLSHERAGAAPNLLVWKLEGRDRYIFNTGTDNGWRIGRYMFLSTGRSYYKSKFLLKSSVRLTRLSEIVNDIYPFFSLGSITKLPKVQAAEWKSSNGLSVQVKCLGKI